MLGNEETRFSIHRHYSLQLAGDDDRDRARLKEDHNSHYSLLSNSFQGHKVGCLTSDHGLRGTW